MITNVETITEAFIQYLENENIATFGQDIFINEVPNSKKVKDSVYWITTSGGAPISKLRTGETIRMHAITIFYRAKSGQEVEKVLHRLGEKLSCAECIQLTGYETIDVSVAQYPATQDLDSENRKLGLLRLNIQTYKTEC
jgi:hypothetical protein